MTKYLWAFTHPSTGPTFKPRVFLDTDDFPGDDPQDRATRMGGQAVRQAMTIFCVDSTAGIEIVEHRMAKSDDLLPPDQRANAIPFASLGDTIPLDEVGNN
jgi:uncharacterized protein YegL